MRLGIASRVYKFGVMGTLGAVLMAVPAYTSEVGGPMLESTGLLLRVCVWGEGAISLAFLDLV